MNEGSGDGECSALMSCQDEKGHDACAQPTEAKLGAEEEKRPETHFNDVETLTAPPEVTSRSAACNCFQNNTQYSTPYVLSCGTSPRGHKEAYAHQWSLPMIDEHRL